MLASQQMITALPKSSSYGALFAIHDVLASCRLPNTRYGVKRQYATHSSLGGRSGPSKGSSRKQITVTSDDGRYNWADLSTSEKAARGTQQTFNFALVAAGAAGTVLVGYFLYQELFAPDSKTRQFNQAVDRIKRDSQCTDLLGDSRSINAFGEPTNNKWARARPLASSTTFDYRGIEHFRMHFNVEGPQNSGVVHVYMTKKPSESELQYETLSLTVRGHPTIYLEDSRQSSPQKKAFKLFGISLG